MRAVHLRRVLVGLIGVMGVVTVSPIDAVLAQDVAFTPERPRFLYRSAAGATPIEVDASRTAVLGRVISLRVDQPTIGRLLTAIEEQTGLTFAYDNDFPEDRPITFRADSITVAAALSGILLDTGVDVLLSRRGHAALVRRSEPKASSQEPGTITGRVTEVESGNPIVNAQVAVDGRGRAFTNDDGRYRIDDVTPGRRTISVRSIGFRDARQEIEVGDGATVTVDFALDVSPTALAEVVVTVTGEQRRLEVGNAIGIIDADAVVPASPVRSLTEAIGSRVPGVQIIQNTGFAGESPRMRIRGVSSVTGSNQPLVYVDGVRVDNSTSSLYDGGDFIGNYGHRGGRFNDINLDEIENIEIVKGPSAATLYGTDAANGVILISTKRGRAGPARWSFFAEGGLSEPAVDFRDNYFSWGTNTTTGAIERCILVQQAAGNCMVDSLTAFQPLNDPETSPIGTGTRGQFGAQVSGGVDRFRYMLSADYEQETGYLEMPELDLQRLREERGVEDIPDWQNHPNTLEKLSLRANASTTVGKAEINLSTSFVSSTTAVPRGNIFAAGYFGAGFRDAADGWSSFGGRPGEAFAVKRDESTQHYTGSLNTRWQALDWLTVRGTVGIDFSSVFFDGLQRRGEGTLSGRTGRRLNIEENITFLTADFGSSAVFDLAAALSSKTSAGFQYNGRLRRSTTATATGLPPGSETVTGAASTLGAEFERESIVAGAYIEQTFGLNDRLFLTGAIRADGSSSFGDRFDAAAYPKGSVSWLLSQEPFFPELPGLDNLRLRAAWGASGVQPGSTDALALVSLFASLVDGATTNGAALQAIGNPELKPERSTEFEAGLDADLFGNRVNIEATYYNKLSTDALIDRPLPISVGVPSRRENIGEVRNWGWEALVSARLVESGLLSWDVMFNGSINHNRLEELDLNATFVGAGPNSRNREGFPLWSRWDFPILGFDDANGNGIIEPAEVEVGDTVAFIGDANPPRQFTVSTALGLFDERLTVSSLFERRSGHVGANFTELNACAFFVTCRAVNDPTAPLWEQARAVAVNKTGTWAGYMEDASFTRWRELAITYRMPEAFAARLGAHSMSVTFSGRNLRLWTDYTSPDPEVNSSAGLRVLGIGNEGNSDNPTAPQTRYWMLRVNVGM